MLESVRQGDVAPREGDITFRAPLRKWCISYVGVGLVVFVIASSGAMTGFVLTSCSRLLVDPGWPEAMAAVACGSATALLCWRLLGRQLRRWWVLRTDGVLAGGGGFRRWFTYDEIRLIRLDTSGLFIDLRARRNELVRLNASDLVAVLETLRSLSRHAPTMDSFGHALLAQDEELEAQSSRQLASEARRRARVAASFCLFILLALTSLFARFIAVPTIAPRRWMLVLLIGLGTLACLWSIFQALALTAQARYLDAIADGEVEASAAYGQIPRYEFRFWPPRITVKYVSREDLKKQHTSPRAGD